MTAPVADPAPWESEQAPSAYDDKPELYVGAAFAGGLVLALLLKKLGPDRD
jgi:hypothetical protein